MKCHRPWNENLKLYFRTELRIGCCAIWVSCCSPRSRSPCLQWPWALLSFFSQKRHFCLCCWPSDQARETCACTTMKAPAHYSAFELWLFRKHWEGHRNAGSGVSRLPWGCLVLWLTCRGEQHGAQQDFGSHTCSELSLAVGTACSCVQLAGWVKRAPHTHALQLPLTHLLLEWEQLNKMLIKKDCCLKVILFLWDPFSLNYLVCCN